MLQKTRIAALLANAWVCVDRLTELGSIKQLPPFHKYKEKLEAIDSGDTKALANIEGHFREFLGRLLYYATKDCKPVPPAGLLKNLFVDKKGPRPLIGELQLSGDVVTAVKFKLGVTSTKVLEDFIAALKSERQLPEILDTLELAVLPPTLGSELTVSYQLPYGDHNWCGSVEEMLAGLEQAAIRANRLASIFKFMQDKLGKDALELIEMQHIFVIFTEARFENDALVDAKFVTAETPSGARQREIKARLEEAMRERTKKVVGLEVGPDKLEYKLEGEQSFIIDLDVVTGW